MASLLWCQPSAMSDWLLTFLPAHMEKRAMPSFKTTEMEKTTKAAAPKVTALWLRSCATESRKKLNPTTARSVPMTMEATSSALP